METFTLDPSRWLIGRVFGRSPLLRRTDRIEALTTLITLFASIVAIPVSGLIGALVYDARYHLHACEDAGRHTVVAVVTGTSPALGADSSMVVVHAKWPVVDGEHTGVAQHRTPVKVDDHIEIWVNRDGNPVRPPTPTWHAVGDAVVIATAILLILGLANAALLAAVRVHLDRARDAQWERDIRCLIDGGWTNQY